MLSPIDTLRARGHRMTVARKALLALFGAECDPVSAQEAYQRLHDRGITVNTATVYRELAFLAQENVLRTVQFHDGIVRYELASAPHHHHVVCTDCRRIDAVAVDHTLCEMGSSVERQTGFTVVRHALEFFGRCKSCSASPSAR